MERLRDFIKQLKNFKNRRHTQKDYDQLFKTNIELKQKFIEANDQEQAKLM